MNLALDNLHILLHKCIIRFTILVRRQLYFFLLEQIRKHTVIIRILFCNWLQTRCNKQACVLIDASGVNIIHISSGYPFVFLIKECCIFSAKGNYFCGIDIAVGALNIVFNAVIKLASDDIGNSLRIFLNFTSMIDCRFHNIRKNILDFICFPAFKFSISRFYKALR